MAPKRTKQSSITSMGFPLLQRPTEMCVDRQIKVLGSYWKGRMSNEEANSLYLCTVRDYHASHIVVHSLKHLPESFKFKDRERSVEQMEAEELEDFVCLGREVMQ